MVCREWAVPVIRGGVVEGACGVGGGTSREDEECAQARRQFSLDPLALD